MQKLVFWFMNARPQALPQSVIPALMAMCAACATGRATWWCAMVALVGIAAAHLSIDLLDDYFDYRNAGIDTRERLARAGMRARIGKAQYLADGKATLKETLRVALVFGGVAIVCGVVIFVYRGWPIVVFAGMAAFMGYFYSAPPFKLCYHGLGEVLTCLMFGPLLMSGMAYATCGEVPAEVWWLSVPTGLLVGNILFTHSILDRQADISVGKRTFAVLLSPDEEPRRRALLGASGCFNFVPYIIMVVGVAVGNLSPWVLITLIPLPMSISLCRLMKDFLYHPERSAERRWWMGPMSQWEAICKGGIEWFMIRWYLSRNILSLFAVLGAVAVFL